MIDLKIKLKGVKKLKKKFGQLSNFLDLPEVRGTMKESGYMTERSAKKVAPWRLGKLRSDITSSTERKGNELIAHIGVRSTTPYAPYLELGTERIKVGKPQSPVSSVKPGTKRPYLSHALYINNKNILMLWQNLIEKLTK